MLTVVLWQHVVFCVSRTLFTTSLVMVVRRVLCTASLSSYYAFYVTSVFSVVDLFIFKT